MIVSRKQWGALVDLYKIGQPRMRPESKGVVVHHTPMRALPASAAEVQEIHELRKIDNYHLKDRDWRGGIGYSFVIANSGRVYECRGMYVGAHTFGANKTHFGVGFLANGEKEGITQEAVKAFYSLCKGLERDGWLKEGFVIKYHRDFVATSCPGDVIIKQLQVSEPAVAAMIDSVREEPLGVEISAVEALRDSVYVTAEEEEPSGAFAERIIEDVINSPEAEEALGIIKAYALRRAMKWLKELLARV